MKNGDVYVLRGAYPILLGVDDYYELVQLNLPSKRENTFRQVECSRDDQHSKIKKEGYYFAFNLADVMWDIQEQILAMAMGDIP
jgi:hypothetical protein